MNTLRNLALTLGIALGMIVTPALSGRARVEAESVVSSHDRPQMKPAAGLDADDAELILLAQREAAATDLEDFRGGDPVLIVIGSSTLVVLLIVVLIVILLR